MWVLFGIILVLVSSLLFTYYRLKANLDDYNRPSFFNSKFRKYFLIFITTTTFVFGESFIVAERYYDLTWFVPLAYYFTYLYVKNRLYKNMVIKKIFQYHMVFKDPSLIKSKDDRLIAPAGFMLMTGNFPKKFLTQANKYLAARVKKGIIKGPKDLPQEVWTIIHSIGKNEIKEVPELSISKRKVDYFYQEIVEGKEHNDFGKKLTLFLKSIENEFERLFKNYAFITLGRPDFTHEEIQLNDVEIFKNGKVVGNETQKIASFSQIPAEGAKKYGWVRDYDEYLVLAALEFQRRFPKHPFSKHIKKQHKYSNQEIFDYAQNWVRLDAGNIKICFSKLLGKF